MSYAHHDDVRGQLSKFRELLAIELHSQTGKDVAIFQDSDDVAAGEQWSKRLDQGLAASTLLLPIITPSFFTSPYCREEYETFRRYEQALGRDDLILPVYYIDCEDLLSGASDDPAAAAARWAFEHQYFDWRSLRSLGPSHQRAQLARIELAKQIRAAMARALASSLTPARNPIRARVPAPERPAIETRVGASAAMPPPSVEVRTPNDVLPACCVRIDVGGRHVGSGFFAAPGIVVTCHHVLRVGDLSSEEAGAGVSVVSPQGATYRVLDQREWSSTEEDDLAILRVEPAHGHAFVLLDTGFRARDTFQTFGFSEEHPDGAAVSLTAESWLETDRKLKVAAGPVRRGMSGSPVLNVRTGAVCGVLKRSGVLKQAREPSLEVGAHVVSVRTLFNLSPTLSSTNFRLHTTHRRNWFDLLPAKQHKLLLAQRTSDPASLPDCLLVISVDQSDEEEWEVRATVQRIGEDDHWASESDLGPIKVDLNSVRALVARVFRDWASRDAAEQGRVGPGEQIRLLGEILSRALLTDEIGRKFDELVARPDHGWIEVALHFSDDVDDQDFREFEQLPWEHLYVPPRPSLGDVYFARDSKLSFVRTLHPDPSTPEPSASKLSLLVVAVKPELREKSEEDATTDDDVDGIVAGLKRLAGELSGALDVTVLESPGLNGLAEAVTSGSYNAVHYIGFGRFDTGSDDRVALAINRASGEFAYHNARHFADCLEGKAMPRLVVLQNSRSSETVPADLAAFGPALLMKPGCLGVVAFQYPVTSELTQKFNVALYTALAEGTPLEMAAQMARKKVWASDPEGRAFLSPAVFVTNPGGLRLIPQGRETASRSRVGALSGHA